MFKHINRFLRRTLTKQRITTTGETRRVTIKDDAPSDRFVLIVGLMVLFFTGLVGLEVVHMIWMGSWNDVIFNGIMLVVGTIVGAVWGKTTQ